MRKSLPFGTLFVVVLIAIGLLVDLSKSDWAAWVQAIGSILAICGAVWATQTQITSQTRLALDAEARSRQCSNDALRAVIDGAAQQFLKLVPVMNLQRDQDVEFLEMLFHYEDRTFNDAINSLETIKLIDLGSYDLVKAIAGIRVGMISLRNAVKQLMDPNRNHEEMPSHQIESYGEGVISRLKAHYLIAATLLGGTPIRSHSWTED